MLLAQETTRSKKTTSTPKTRRLPSLRWETPSTPRLPPVHPDRPTVATKRTSPARGKNTWGSSGRRPPNQKMRQSGRARSRATMGTLCRAPRMVTTSSSALRAAAQALRAWRPAMTCSETTEAKTWATRPPPQTAKLPTWMRGVWATTSRRISATM